MKSPTPGTWGGGETPMDSGGRSKLGPQPDTAPEPLMVPDSGRRSPIKGGQPSVPMSSVQPEALDNMLEALQGASIVDEDRVLMGTVIEKVQSTKSGLSEAYTSHLRGFEVCFMRFRRVS